MKKGVSLETVRRANMAMILGEKPAYRISDRFTREDIRKAWEIAARKVRSGENNDE